MLNIAFVKYKYKWTYFYNTIVFGYLISDNKYNIIFLDTINNNKQGKLVYNLVDILSSDFLCAIIQEREENQYSFMITNNFCNVLDTKFCPIKPIYSSMNNEFIAISDYDYVYVLQYKGYIKPKLDGTNDRNKMTQSDFSLTMRTRFNMTMNKLDPKAMNEFCFFIDDDLNPGISNK